MIEIRPAALSQVVNYRGKRVMIEADVADIAVRLREVDPQLKLLYMPDAEPPYWQVERHVEQADGSTEEQLVLTSLDLGAHIVERVRYIGSEQYDFAGELEKLDAEAEDRKEAHFEERRKEALEELAWALRKDTGTKKHF